MRGSGRRFHSGGLPVEAGGAPPLVMRAGPRGLDRDRDLISGIF